MKDTCQTELLSEILAVLKDIRDRLPERPLNTAGNTVSGNICRKFFPTGRPVDFSLSRPSDQTALKPSGNDILDYLYERDVLPYEQYDENTKKIIADTTIRFFTGFQNSPERRKLARALRSNRSQPYPNESSEYLSGLKTVLEKALRNL